jgi:hypothetical protein
MNGFSETKTPAEYLLQLAQHKDGRALGDEKQAEDLEKQAAELRAEAAAERENAQQLRAAAARLEA